MHAFFFFSVTLRPWSTFDPSVASVIDELVSSVTNGKVEGGTFSRLEHKIRSMGMSFYEEVARVEALDQGRPTVFFTQIENPSCRRELYDKHLLNRLQLFLFLEERTRES